MTGSPRSAIEPTTRIAFIGDTLLGGDAQAMLTREGDDYALGAVLPLLGRADFAVANHEGPLTHLDRRADKADYGRKRYWYRGRPSVAAALYRAGVRVVSLANNHVLDFGPEGLAETITALEDAGIRTCGAGENETEARRPAIVIQGGSRIGFISCMQRYEMYVRERAYAGRARPGPYRLRIERIREDLESLKGIVDLRVVLVHWGRNYRDVSTLQERLADQLREAGADLIVGHHPHVAQRINLDGGRPVLFSLGNGALGTPGRFHGKRLPYGLIATIEIDGRSRLRSLDLDLIAVNNAVVHFRPRLVEDAASREALGALVDADRWRAAGFGLRTEFDQPRASR
ncbi:MAG: hypothetical protein NVS9B8_18550 [Candidatus Limnocylindrales bacterium]